MYLSPFACQIEYSIFNLTCLVNLGTVGTMFRRHLAPILRKAATQFPAVFVAGPRQAGKTTLVRAVFPRLEYVSLEDPAEREFAVQDPKGFLGRFRGGVILDEAQRAPDLLSSIQTIIDE